jgi:hypothetical protein
MSCHKIQDLFADFLTGEADEAARREVQDHIASCAACRADLEEITAAWARLGLLPAEAPSGRLRAGFYAMLDAAKEEEERRAARPRAGRLFAAWWEGVWAGRPALAMGLAGALFVIGLGAGIFLNGGRAAARDMASLALEVQDMRQQVALTLLDRPSASDRLQGVSYAERLERPEPRTLDALFATLNEDGSVNVRLAAVDALYLFRDRPGVKDRLVETLSRQTSPSVQVALIDLLVEVRERRASDALRSLVKDGRIDPSVRTRAEQGLKELI